jgi:hypothetical protein
MKSSLMLSSYLIASVFAIAAVAKVNDFTEFRTTLERSMLVPAYLVPAFAISLIVAEFVVALCLLARPTGVVGANLALALSSLFVAYAFWRWLQDIRAPCSCFGLLFKLPPGYSAVISLSLAACSAWLAQNKSFALFNSATTEKQL